MRYLKNSSWLYFEKVLRILVALVVGVWVTRYLGPKQFGLLSYAKSFFSLFGVIYTLGLDTIIVRELLKNKYKKEELLSTVFCLRVFGAIVTLLLISIVVDFTSNDTETNLLIFIIAGSALFHPFNVIDNYFQSKVLSKYVVFANVISLFLSSITRLFLLYYEAPLEAFAYVFII